MPASRKPLNYTTAVPVARTVGECQEMLAAAGAASVAVHYEGGDPCGLSFQLRTPHGPRSFTLPVNIDGVRAMLVKASKDGKLRSDGYRVAKFETREHAASVAWRVIRDWVEAEPRPDRSRDDHA